MSDKEKSTKIHAIYKNYTTARPGPLDNRLIQGMTEIFEDAGLLAILDLFCQERDSYSDRDPLATRIANANKISNHSTDLRRKVKSWGEATILKEHGSAVINMVGLSAQEVLDITDLYNVLMAKIRPKTRGAAMKSGGAGEMYNSFIQCVDVFKTTGFFPNSWINSAIPKVAKMKSHCTQTGKAFPNFPSFACPDVCDPAKFKATKKLIIDASNIPMPAKAAPTTAASSAYDFAVDYWVVLAAQLRRPYKMPALTDPMDSYCSPAEFDPVMRIIAAFTQGTKVSKLDLNLLISGLKPEIQAVLSDLSTEVSLYMNPAKLTVGRLYGSISTSYTVCSTHGILNGNYTVETFQLLAKVYNIEKPLQTGTGTTSDGEYLLHEILTLGLNGGFHFNKNEIAKSAASVKFTVSEK